MSRTACRMTADFSCITLSYPPCTMLGDLSIKYREKSSHATMISSNTAKMMNRAVFIEFILTLYSCDTVEESYQMRVGSSNFLGCAGGCSDGGAEAHNGRRRDSRPRAKRE